MPNFSIPLSGLTANSTALSAISNNLANLNTVGYTRKRPLLSEDTTLTVDAGAIGSGVHLEGIESIRDKMIELRIEEQSQESAFLNGYLEGMNQLEATFGDLENGISAKIDDFFTNVAKIATSPADISQRQNILSSAGNLASSIRSSAQAVKSMQSNLDAGITQGVEVVNELSAEIASLNRQVAAAEKMGKDGGGFEDRQTELIRKLCEQVDVAVIQSSDGVTLTTKSGVLLVAGSKAFELTAAWDGSGHSHVFAQQSDVTSQLSGGRIGGLIRARDEGAVGVLTDLDTLAYGLATAVNEANKKGFDLDGDPGEDIFSASGLDGAAAGLSVVMSDPRNVAASSDGAPGGVGNLQSFAAVRDGAVIDGQTPTGFYAGIVSRIGGDIAGAKADSDAAELAMQQLENRRGAISGVSLDEEAANLVRFQRSFEASARVISVIDEMLQTLLAMGK